MYSLSNVKHWKCAIKALFFTLNNKSEILLVQGLYKEMKPNQARKELKISALFSALWSLMLNRGWRTQKRWLEKEIEHFGIYGVPPLEANGNLCELARLCLHLQVIDEQVEQNHSDSLDKPVPDTHSEVRLHAWLRVLIWKLCIKINKSVISTDVLSGWAPAEVRSAVCSYWWNPG